MRARWDKMINTELDLTVKVGLLLVALSWFSFTFYELVVGIIHRAIIWPIILTDIPGTIGLSFRTAAGLIAVIIILSYLVKRELSRQETLLSLRWVVILEAAFFVLLIPSALWGLLTDIPGYPREQLIVSTGLPMLIEGVIMPIVLTKLFFQLNPKKSDEAIVKWGLVYGTAYLFVSWLNYTLQWIYAIMQKGIEFVSLYPINVFGFALTAAGLFVLTLYAALFSKKSFGKETLTKSDLERVGFIVTALGLYANVMYLLWIFFGSVGGWNVWHAFFLGHNMDLWFLALPFVGVPLLFQTGH